MGAITGIFQFDLTPVSDNDADTLMQSLEKYPANDIRTWHEGSIFLGCLAQWITPESVHERLPYYDALTKLAITADAIIDNRAELFDRLQIEPIRRQQMKDSELILLAYRRWGVQAPAYLIGDFAFVIWDDNKKLLFSARDLSGNRTLYYHRDHRRFAFSTTIMPLLALPSVMKKLNETWLAEYMAIPDMFESSDVGSTVYKDIYQLPPAHCITVVEGAVSLSQYGTLSPDKNLKLNSNEQYEEAFREVFQQAVASGLRTHRQVCATLSGGLDSGTVVSYAATALRQQNKRLHTYSYIPVSDFVDWTPRSMVADERPYIQATVQHVGNISDHYLDFAGKSPFTDVDDWLELLEMPYKYFENSFWIKGVFEKCSEQDAGVLLTGAGGNHSISWGPAVDYYALQLKKLRWVHLYRELQLFSKRKGIRRSRLLPIIGRRALHSLVPAFLSANSQPDMPLLLHPEFARTTHVLDKIQEVNAIWAARDAFEARDNHFQSLHLANLIGTKGTKLSLRYALREFDPTNDQRVVRFCLGVPLEQYVQNGYDRALVRRSTERILPDKVRLNQRIRGIQAADWVHRMIPLWPAVQEELQQLCRDSLTSGIMNVEQVEASLSRFGNDPRPEYAIDPDMRFLMRCLVVYRFLKQF